MRGLIGKKIGMTQIYNHSGGLIPVTVVEAGPCVVTQVKTKSNDGYEAIQVGFGQMKEKHSNKALNGHFTKAGTEMKKYLAEFVPVPDYEYKAGQEFGVSLFREGEYVDVVGTTKGKGFSGGVKRYGFKGGPKTHGQSDRHRAVGSIGAGSSPGRVWPGTKMPGQYGNKTATVKGLKVVKVDVEENILLLRGAIPGFSGATVRVEIQ